MGSGDQAGERRMSLKPELCDRVRVEFGHELAVYEDAGNTTLESLGLDSLSVLEVVFFCEAILVEEFQGIPLDSDAIEAVDLKSLTLSRLVDLVVTSQS